MKIRYLNLSVNDLDHRREIMEVVENVLIHGQIILGPEVSEFEQKHTKNAKASSALAMLYN